MVKAAPRPLLPAGAKLFQPMPRFTSENSRVFTVDGVKVVVLTSAGISYVANPKVPGNMAHGRYAKYMRARTIEQALALGSAEGDLRFDLSKGHLTFKKPLSCAPWGRRESFASAVVGVQSLLRSVRKTCKEKATGFKGSRSRALAKVEELQKHLPLRVPLPAVPHNMKTSDSILPSKMRCDSFCVVVLSHPHDQRIHILQNNTWAFLQHHKVPRDRIYLVVASQSEATKYRASLGNESPTILVAEKGVVKARSFIFRYFDSGTHVVSLDDDIKDVQMLSNRQQLHSLPAEGFQGLVRHAFEMMCVQKAFAWALNVSSDSRKWGQSICRSVGLLNGHFYGFIARPKSHKELLPTLGEAAEDVERSIRLFLSDGIVLRYMMYHAETKPYQHEGGLTGLFSSRIERKRAEITHCRRLAKEFPALVSMSPKKLIRTLCMQWAQQLGLPSLKPQGNEWVASRGASTSKGCRKKPASSTIKIERVRS